MTAPEPATRTRRDRRRGVGSAPQLALKSGSAASPIRGRDRAGTITLANAQAERLFGYRRDELIGQLIEILVPDRALHYTPPTAPAT